MKLSCSRSTGSLEIRLIKPSILDGLEIFDISLTADELRIAAEGYRFAFSSV
jgi:hypothetical protein